MNDLTKYILILITTTLIITGGITLSSDMAATQKEEYYSQQEIHAILNQGQLITSASIKPNVYDEIAKLLISLFLFGLPSLMIFLSTRYQYKHPTIEGYKESLLIPISYVLANFLLTLTEVNGTHEAGIFILLYWCILLIIFLAVAGINYVIYSIKRT